MHDSWNRELNGQNFLSFWTSFCPFTLLTITKIKTLKKWKKRLDILSFYKCVPQMTILWCMVPEIWSMTNRFFLSFWTIFCLFTLSNNRENEHFEKLKKTPGDIINLYRCTRNKNHMIFGSSVMECDGQNFFIILDFFFPFTTRPAPSPTPTLTPNNLKNQN